MDNTNDNSNDAREARRAARRAGHTTTTSNNNNNGPSSSSSSSIQNEINEIVPHRRNDNKDINHELQNDRHHLAMQHSNERHNRSNNNLSNNNYDRRQVSLPYYVPDFISFLRGSFFLLFGSFVVLPSLFSPHLKLTHSFSS